MLLSLVTCGLRKFRVIDFDTETVSHERALPTSIFSLAPFMGPILGPIIGSIVAEKYGFRWNFWVSFFLAIALYLLNYLLVAETYAPVLIQRKTSKLQKQAESEGTGEHFRSRYETEKVSLGQKMTIAMTRPIRMLASEIIVVALGLYGESARILS